MKILLITPNFFDYPTAICEELRGMGHEVDWFDDRPSTNPFIKAIIRVNKKYINTLIRIYSDKIMNTVRNKLYDKVLVISGQSFSFTDKMLIELKASQSQAEFILYQWDSLNNFGYIQSLQKYFDRCYSFDMEDTINDSKLKFLPLFYSQRYGKIGNQNTDGFIHDICFVGTAHPKKYKFVREMAQRLAPIYINQFIYFFFPSRIVFIYRKLKNVELKHSHYSEFHFKPIDGNSLAQIIGSSRCILDSAQHGQNGLTIRVIECLGAKRKVITTNSNITKYDFYKDENVYVYDGNFDLTSPFFTKPYAELPKEIYEKYSLHRWLEELLGVV